MPKRKGPKVISADDVKAATAALAEAIHTNPMGYIEANVLIGILNLLVAMDVRLAAIESGEATA